MFRRIVVFNNDGTNSSKFVGGKERRNGMAKLAKEAYLLKGHTRIVKAWRFGWRFNCITSYYNQGVAHPIDLPHLEVVKLSQDSDDLNEIFTPWIYNVLGKKSKPVPYNDLGFWLQLGTAAGVVYLIMMIRDIQEVLRSLGI